jgi:exopolyphosphatase/guanosine-5'-triphosphate,3'-diphosphate pyrophosphatase
MGAERVMAIATSAVRDATNGDAFIAELRERFSLDARLLTGEEEAHLTYLGATAHRSGDDPTLVFDIGGGSTELLVGSGMEVGFHTSLQAGTIRQSERHLTSDPPDPHELEDLASDIRKLIDRAIADHPGARPSHAIAVAGTPTSLAAIDQQLEPYDPGRVHGYRLGLSGFSGCSAGSRQCRSPSGCGAWTAPGRAPTIVAGTVILVQVMRRSASMKSRSPSSTSCTARRSRPRWHPPDRTLGHYVAVPASTNFSIAMGSSTDTSRVGRVCAGPDARRLPPGL